LITVACVLRSGGRYNSEWVRKLRDGVARHLTLPHRFVCLSDVDAPCERIPLETDWRGWWSKISLFRTTLFDGPVLYFDLDSVVVGSLDAVAAYPHTFTMAHEFYRPHLLCSTAMAWSGDYSFLYEAFAADPDGIAKHYDKVLPGEGRIGDQAFIEDQFAAFGDRPATFRDLFGEHCIASYKVHGCQKAPPQDAAVVAFHGRPKPDEIKTGWVADAWR
jgi:hypothetical protein